MIDSKDISVVVQGAVNKHLTSLCLFSVRKHLPNAEIILSTWQNADVSGLEFDKVIFNSDPGSLGCPTLKNANKSNVNRQIVSTINGLRAATRKYALKIRTDFMLQSDGFLKYFGQYQKYDKQYMIFQHKILSCTNFARPAEFLTGRYLFHPSDIAFFGLKSDLIILFDVPLQTCTKKDMFFLKGTKQLRFVPEQHLWISCLRKNGKDISYNGLPNKDHNLYSESTKYLLSNFILLSWRHFSLVPPRKFYDLTTNDYLNTITESEYIQMYNNCFNTQINVPKDDLKRLLKRHSKDVCANFISRICVLPLFFWDNPRRFLRKKIRCYLNMWREKKIQKLL